MEADEGPTLGKVPPPTYSQVWFSGRIDGLILHRTNKGITIILSKFFFLSFEKHFNGITHISPNHDTKELTFHAPLVSMFHCSFYFSLQRNSVLQFRHRAIVLGCRRINQFTRWKFLKKFCSDSMHTRNQSSADNLSEMQKYSVVLALHLVMINMTPILHAFEHPISIKHQVPA